jgi:LysM repeat protein
MHPYTKAQRYRPVLGLSFAALSVAACSATARFDLDTAPDKGKSQQERSSWRIEKDSEPATRRLGWSARTKENDALQYSVVTVRHGETLHGIANSSGITVPTLVAANGLSSDQISPGQQLVVPKRSVVSQSNRW